MDFINISQLLWQVANFLVFYVVIARYVVPPVSKMLDKRKKEIEDGLSYAQKAKKELELSEQKREEILKQARIDAVRIVDEAKKRGEQVILEAHSQAKIEAEREYNVIVKRANEEIKRRQEALDKEVVELAMVVLEKSLRHSLAGTQGQDLVRKQLSSLTSVKEYVK